MLRDLAAEEHPSSELRLPAWPSKLGLAREYAHAAAAAFGLGDEGCYELAYAVNEAVTNAIRHGEPDEHGDIRLSVFASERRLTVAVRDFGTFSAAAPQTGAPADGGRGFALMASLMDAVQLSLTPGSTTVRLSKVRS